MMVNNSVSRAVHALGHLHRPKATRLAAKTTLASFGHLAGHTSIKSLRSPGPRQVHPVAGSRRDLLYYPVSVQYRAFSNSKNGDGALNVNFWEPIKSKAALSVPQLIDDPLLHMQTNIRSPWSKADIGTYDELTQKCPHLEMKGETDEDKRSLEQQDGRGGESDAFEQSFEQMLRDVIDTKVAPAIQADGGDITFIAFEHETQTCKVQLSGACLSCSKSSITLRFMVERVLKHYFPDQVARVVNVDVEAENGAEPRAYE